MTDSDFKASILEKEVVIAYLAEGHIYRFPILSNGTISMHGSLTEPNADSKISAKRFLSEAYTAARAALNPERH
jgi:hypothetical protein